MGGERSAVRQAAAGVAAAAGGVAGEPRAPVSGAGGAGVAAGDEQRHDRPVAGPDPQEERRRRVPVRTFKGWDDHSDPGWLVIDLVAHCGGRMEGRFLWTLMAKDIATGWSESLPILMRDGAVVLTALQLIRRQLPFPLRGIDANNDLVYSLRPTAST